MGFITNISALIKNPRLSYSVFESKRIMRKYRKTNVFDSKTLNELFTDTFKYRGKESNTIFIKNSKSAQPEPVKVVFKYSDVYNRETFLFKDANNNIIGCKQYGINSNPETGLYMYLGLMENKSKGVFKGIGIRADQLQIERALQNGILQIPRESAAVSTLFHAKMGFLPVQGSLICIKKYKDAIKYISEYAKKSPAINPSNFKPIIVHKNGKFFIDLNKTQANANVKEIKQRLEKSGGYKIDCDFKAPNVELQLSGAELTRWEKLIKKQPLLETLDFEFPIYK